METATNRNALRQRTLANASVPIRGVGLHSGNIITMRLLPAVENSGISIKYLSNNGKGDTNLKVCSNNVKDTLLATTIANSSVQVSTVEHLLCALCLCGVDNVIIEINGPEVPIMDGSAQPFILLIRDTGLLEQQGYKRFIVVKEEVAINLSSDSNRYAKFTPTTENVSWNINIDFNDAVVSKTPQSIVKIFSDQQELIRQVAAARTFGFIHEVDYMRSQQRALGGSLNNALVLDGKKILNKNGLRQENEFVAHKLLDVIGDCYIEGKLVIGNYQATMPGHQLNHELMLKLINSKDAWEEVSADNLDPKLLPDFGPVIH